jgi:hypothetical protein
VSPSKKNIIIECLNFRVDVKSKSFTAKIINKGAYALMKSKVAVTIFGFTLIKKMFAQGN